MNPFLGQLLLVPYNFQPTGWMFCNGQILPIAQYTALFSLLGTTYGGDGQSNFALPDLRGRTAVGQGQGAGLQNYVLGERLGVETVILTTNQLPLHTHQAYGTSQAASTVNVAGAVLASGQTIYRTNATPQPLAPNVCSSAGNNLPHDNWPPYLTLNWIIAMEGIYPSRS
jgi:microcystin-dependent protein